MRKKNFCKKKQKVKIVDKNVSITNYKTNGSCKEPTN